MVKMLKLKKPKTVFTPPMKPDGKKFALNPMHELLTEEQIKEIENNEDP